MLYENILDAVGKTPIVNIDVDRKINLFAKLEYANPMGSIKDRAANFLLDKLLRNGTINRDTTIIESSSGNFGVALAAYCKKYGLKFICVIDPLISPINKIIIQTLGAKIVEVRNPDSTGGYLLNRLKAVRKIVNESDNIYWVNQYENLINAQAYEETIGLEIKEDIGNERMDYAFIGVSSGGTITGLSKCLKKIYPEIKIIAVDIEGSVIFGNIPQRRNLPGIGSSMVPPILNYAYIDDIKIVSEKDATEGCLTLLRKYNLFVGGSSGAVFSAISNYTFGENSLTKTNIFTVFPDSGNRYHNIVFKD